jgi:cytidyltransferase-like protein
LNTLNKLIPFDLAHGVITKARSGGKTIVQCHGTFDLIHPGHIVHFEEAKALGDILVVTITDENNVNKGPGRPFFNDQLRAQSISALSFVDFVVLIPFPSAVEAIECIRPDIYCKGLEYKNDENDVTGNILDDRSTVENLGGQISYVGSVVFSSTRLLNNHFSTQTQPTKQFCREVAKAYGNDGFREAVESFRNLNVLVVGDIIFDRYTNVSVQGLTSKNRILSTRFISDDLQAGGALAVVRHLKEFASNIKLVSILGNESWVDDEVRKYIGPDEDHILRVPNFTSIIKQRFVEPKIRSGHSGLHHNELSKLFSVNYIDQQQPIEKIQQIVIKRIGEQIKDADLVLVMDFGHGVMEPLVREFVQENAKFLALNCQTNSNNYGFNLINNNYIRADSFSLDQTEISLALGKREMNFEMELEALRENLKSKYAWLTRGGDETIGAHKSKESVHCPSFESNVVDPIGAGDAFCSIASMAAAKGLPLKLSTFMAQLAGAQAVKIIGNSESISKSRLLKSAEAMLNF